MHGGDLNGWAEALRSAIDKLSSTPAILEALRAEQQARDAPTASAARAALPTLLTALSSYYS